MKAQLTIRLALASALVFLASTPASAAMITLGDQDFTNGQFLAGALDFNTPSAGEPAPFDAFIGSDISTDFSAMFTFNFAPDTYLVGSLTFGIWDHDSAHFGDQVALFELDGVDLTAELNALLNASGGVDNGFFGQPPGSEYNVYSIALTGPALAAVADGVAAFTLTLQGPTAGAFGNTSFNGAGLDFATLSVNAVPEPSTWMLLTLGLAGIALRRRRQ